MTLVVNDAMEAAQKTRGITGMMGKLLLDQYEREKERPYTTRTGDDHVFVFPGKRRGHQDAEGVLLSVSRR